jgi:hypothetical protein
MNGFIQIPCMLDLFNFSRQKAKYIYMSWKKKAWVATGTVVAVEELKEEKLCGWSSPIRSLHHQQESIDPLPSQGGRSCSPLSPTSSSSSKMLSKRRGDKQEQQKQSEESLRKVMYLSLWGPN